MNATGILASMLPAPESLTTGVAEAETAVPLETLEGTVTEDEAGAEELTAIELELATRMLLEMAWLVGMTGTDEVDDTTLEVGVTLSTWTTVWVM